MSRSILASVSLVSVLAACASQQGAGFVVSERPAEPAHSAASLQGEVLGVDDTPPSDALASGTRVELRSKDDSPVWVDLAPGWYLDEKGIRYSPRDLVEVQGTYVERRGQRVFFAKRVIQNGRTVELRDAQGRPLWPSQQK